jgi:TetR/AcrR family transcriptional repressor of nem operon
MPQVSARGKLVEHAEGVFRCKGFSGASVQDIAAAAEVPKGSFYNHFRSKKELAAEIVRRYGAATEFGMLAGDASPVGRLRAHFVAQADRTRSTGVEFGCLLVTMASDAPTAGEEVRHAVRETIEAWTDALAAVIEEGRQTGEIRPGPSARDVAAFLIDAFEGGALRGKATEDDTASMRSLNLALDSLQR